MGLVHQECLISWLEVTRGDGRCEICKTKFCFDPQYAENTPDRLPVPEVVLGLSSRFLAKWLPLALRICFAAFLWLVVAPYLTNCLYLGWIIRPSSILARQETILSDIVSGAVIGTTVIISFLSLMSFADFLRVLWQQPPGERHPQGGEEPPEEGREIGGADEEKNEEEADGNAADNRIIEFIERNKNEAINDSPSEIDNTTTRDSSVAQQMDNDTRIRNTERGGGIEEEKDEDIHFADAFHRSEERRQRAERARKRNADLRNLALEREARRQNDDGERNLADNDDDSDDDQADRVIDQVVPLADDNIDIRRRGMDDEFNYESESDDEEMDENVNDEDDDDDDDDAWMDNDDDDNDEDDAIPLFPQPGVAIDDDVAFDPMDPVLQDDQVVSAVLSFLIQIQFRLPILSNEYLLFSTRIWRSMSHWMNYLAFGVP